MNQSSNKQKRTNGLQGRWTKSEKQRFILGYQKFGRDWVEVAKVVKTRKLTQVRSHAQKFFARMQQNGMDPGSDQQNSDQISYREQSSINQNQLQYSPQKIFKQNHQKQRPINDQKQQKKYEPEIVINKCNIETKETSIEKISEENVLNKQKIKDYLKNEKYPSNFMQCLMLNWNHFNNGGNFLQYPIIDNKNLHFMK